MTQQNSKCLLCSDRDKMINHIISECSRLVQKSIRLATTGSCAKNFNLPI